MTPATGLVSPELSLAPGGVSCYEGPQYALT